MGGIRSWFKHLFDTSEEAIEKTIREQDKETGIYSLSVSTALLENIFLNAEREGGKKIVIKTISDESVGVFYPEKSGDKPMGELSVGMGEQVAAKIRVLGNVDGWRSLTEPKSFLQVQVGGKSYNGDILKFQLKPELVVEMELVKISSL